MGELCITDAACEAWPPLPPPPPAPHAPPLLLLRLLLAPCTQNLNGKAHFTSLHGKVGILTLALAAAAPLLGAASFRRLGLIQRFPEGWRAHIKWLHRLVSAG